jgi:hypothetical protein
MAWRRVGGAWLDDRFSISHRVWKAVALSTELEHSEDIGYSLLDFFGLSSIGWKQARLLFSIFVFFSSFSPFFVSTLRVSGHCTVKEAPWYIFVDYFFLANGNSVHLDIPLHVIKNGVIYATLCSLSPFTRIYIVPPRTSTSSSYDASLC